jgi:hypothetical protein
MLFSREYLPRHIIVEEFQNRLQKMELDIRLSASHLMRRDGYDEEGCNWSLQTNDISASTRTLHIIRQTSRHIHARYNIDPLLDDCQQLADETLRSMRVSFVGSAVRRRYQNVVVTLATPPDSHSQMEVLVSKELVKTFAVGRRAGDKQQAKTSIATCEQAISKALAE